MQFFHATVLSNFARGYDKYRRSYSKAGIPRSSYPDQFFLLSRDDLKPGITKAERLLEKLGIEGDRVILIGTEAAPEELFSDHATGIGQYVRRNHIEVRSVAYIDRQEIFHRLTPARVEDITAASLRITAGEIAPWERLRPRTISVLPIAVACQASCRFCFSKASVSADHRGRFRNWDGLSRALQAAKNAGAERAVITGGGEPTLLQEEDMLRLVSQARAQFPKVVLITNAHLLALKEDAQLKRALGALAEAGLSVLAISRHHHHSRKAAGIMGLDVDLPRIARAADAIRERHSQMRLRLICVLQKGGVQTVEDIEAYLTWASRQGIGEVNFKELYVSTGIESGYAHRAANEYSARMQVPLRIVHDFAEKHGWARVAELPWGAPILIGEWGGRSMQIAAYTEPSVHWERSQGIARSWNLMSDGKILCSLEDINSEIDIDEFH